MLVNFSFDSKSPEKGEQAQDEYLKRLYEKYTAERAELNRTALEVGGRYDKAVFILAGGAFALSITFIEKIAPNPTVFSIAYLGASWTFLLFSLVTSLYATSNSQGAIQRQIVLLDITYEPLLYPERQKEQTTNYGNPYIRKSEFMVVAARTSLAFGLICLCAFAVLNIFNKNTNYGSKTSAPQTNTARSSP